MPSHLEFSEDWFSKAIPTWDALLATLAPSRILEVGAYEGRATCYLIERCGAHRGTEIHCVDTWQGGAEHDPAAMTAVEARFDRNVAHAAQATRFPVTVFKIKEASRTALPTMIAAGKLGYFDFVYVDGSHRAADVLSDAVDGFRLLRIGGLLVFDDYLWSPGSPDTDSPLDTPKLAIDAFLTIHLRQVRVMRGLPIYQIYCEKIAP
jgi:predicted O-methyltransferase YrrM